MAIRAEYAKRQALTLVDDVVTAASSRADLGREKFIEIKCRKAGLRPNGEVTLATERPISSHGGAKLKTFLEEKVAALERGMVNLKCVARRLGRGPRSGPLTVSVSLMHAMRRAPCCKQPMTSGFLASHI